MINQLDLKVGRSISWVTWLAAAFLNAGRWSRKIQTDLALLVGGARSQGRQAAFVEDGKDRKFVLDPPEKRAAQAIVP